MKGKRFAVAMAALLATLTAVLGQTDDWPMAGHDAQRTSDSLPIIAPPLTQATAVVLPGGSLGAAFVAANGRHVVFNSNRGAYKSGEPALQIWED